MALTSMTGYGRATGESDAWRVEVECNSVNRDRLDVRAHLASGFSHLEPTVRSRVRDRVARGKVDVRVDFEARTDGETPRGRIIDEGRFEAVVRELQEASERTATGPVNLSDVLEFRDFFERERPFEVERDDETLLAALDEAVDRLQQSRIEEGDGLEEDLLGHLEDLEEALEAYRSRLPDEIRRIRSRVEERVRESLDEFDGETPDEDRLAREVVHYADRSDVSEELQRATSHVGSARELVAETDRSEPVGKELDFYLQELVRETNTLSSKSVTSELTDLAVSMKSTVDQMREQAANVE